MLQMPQMKTFQENKNTKIPCIFFNGEVYHYILTSEIPFLYNSIILPFEVLVVFKPVEMLNGRHPRPYVLENTHGKQDAFTFQLSSQAQVESFPKFGVNPEASKGNRFLFINISRCCPYQLKC